MNLANLFSPQSAAIVLLGTLIATVLRCGLKDCLLAVRELGRSFGERFDADQTRAEMAVQVQEIRKDGLLRASPHHFGDREFDDATDALIGNRSVGALIQAHEHHRARRVERADRAVRTLSQAADLAPVFGLAGTLISLSQLPDGGVARAQFGAAISMAVLTTLYGLLLANLVLAPLARLVDRSCQDEERERQKIVDWLATQVAPVMPRAKVHAAHGEAA